MSRNSRTAASSGTGKKQLAFLFSGVLLVALAPLTLILVTVPEMTPDGWYQRVLVFVLLLWFCVAVGLASIGGAYFSSSFARNIYLLICFGAGIGVCVYPGIYQLVAGESKVNGQIEKVVNSTAKDGFWISPQSKTVSKRRVRKYDVVVFQSLSGNSVSVKLIRSDVERLLAVAKETGAKLPLKVVYLKHLRRLVSVEVANP